MPVYEYECQDCNEHFESRVSSWSQADAVACRSCSGENVRRMISRVTLMGGSSRDLAMAPAKASGGCCGGACGCGHG